MKASEKNVDRRASPAPKQALGQAPASSRAVAIPEKLFYKIGEVSRITGLEAYVLRYWETEFPILRPRNTAGGQRVYAKKDVELILEIKRMLYEQGYTIVGAKKQLQAGRGGTQQESGLPTQLIGAVKGQLRAILEDLKAFEKKSPSIGA